MPRATQEYNLRVINPSLSKEWHPKKNGSLTPRDVTPGSNRKIWWICRKGHQWKAKIDNRNGGTGCPYCSKKAVSEDICLQTLNPSLAAEWHPTKNGSLTPGHVRQYSNKIVWWICSKGHEWKAYIRSRSNGSGCPYCSGQRVCTDNCLETVDPDLARQWHTTKNGDLTPKDVVSHSDKKVWWVCEKGHEWQARISQRSNGTGCPYCARERRYSGKKTR